MDSREVTSMKTLSIVALIALEKIYSEYSLNMTILSY